MTSGTADARAADVLVAVGASAANTHSLQRFLTQLVLHDGMAAVVILQHREALDEDGFKCALAEAGRKLTIVRNDASVEPGRIYLPASNVIVTMEDGRFQTRPAEQDPGERGTIDSFLVSLARNEDGRSIAVIFDGTGGDGTLGVTAVKEVGGLTLAEETEEHRAGELASSNSPAALADFLLPADQLAERIAAHGKHLSRQNKDARSGAGAAETSAALASIATILRSRIGHDFHGYKPGTFLRRVQRRMQVVQTEEIGQYIEVLRTRPDEAQNLFNDLLIGVTQFFRDRREFELLETRVIPKLFENKTQNNHLRVWVIGCSTGEEAYSIAILLREHMAGLDEVPQVQIFATDLDGRALAFARVGRYTSDIAKDMSPERLARWFVKEGDTYCVAKELREMCIFSQHSIIKDAPFSRLDLVSCRNLLIYLDADLQSRVIPLFHFALQPGGFLFLGNSENVSRHTSLFAPLDQRIRIYQRLETGTRILPDFPLMAIERRVIAPSAASRPRAVDGSLVRRAERIAERYAPAYVITDDAFNVLHFSGRTGRYIDPAGGAATLNLLSLSHPDLRQDLRAALTKASEDNEVAEVKNRRLGVNGHTLLIDLAVEPVQDHPASPRNFVVIFKDGAAAPGHEENEQPDFLSSAQDERVQRLEAELRTANERLQATVEELESTNEELKSSNEEYQSLNEELQSANEELETSKEELQSVNEELTTVNGELAHRVQELGRANSDLKNLLESTQIATVFLDNELRVMNYTPAVTEIFHLIESDIGRPIGHIKSRVAYEELQDDVRRVLRTLAGTDHQVESTTGTRYMVRVLPYRSVDNFIGGAVVTFVNTTPLTRAQEALRESEKRLRTLMEGIPQLVWRARSRGDWTWASPQWMRFTGQSQAASLGTGWLEAVHPDDHGPVMQAWEDAERQGMLDIEYRVRRASDDAYFWHHTRSVPVRGEPDAEHPEGRILEWLGTTTDVQQLKELQDRQHVMVAELQHRTRNLIAVVRSIASQTMALSGSTEAFHAAFNDRLSALSRVQGLLSQADQEPITIGALVRLELEALGADLEEDRIRISGPKVPLRNRIVQTLALGIHELATNARKYGALSNGQGRLSVSWSTRREEGESRRLALEWTETGIELEHEKQGPMRAGGYGRQLIEKALPYSLGATTSYELGENGLTCTIDLPLAQE